MDTARINAQGITPLTPQLQAIDALADQATLTIYLRERAAEGRNPLFGFGADADFKNSSMNIAYAMQGGLSLPDKTYYFDADKADIRKAYEAHIVKLLQLSGVPADAAAARGGRGRRLLLGVRRTVVRRCRRNRCRRRSVEHSDLLQAYRSDSRFPTAPGCPIRRLLLVG